MLSVEVSTRVPEAPNELRGNRLTVTAFEQRYVYWANSGKSDADAERLAIEEARLFLKEKKK